MSLANIPDYVRFFPQIDASRFAAPKMKRIILHWTAGAYGVIPFELQHYHGVIDQQSRFHFGIPIAHNKSPLNRERGYAAHTLGLNEDSIGISVDCMKDAQETPDGCIPGPAPFTERMYWAMIHYVNQIALANGIPVTHATIFSHAEAPLLGYPQRGKWDFTRLPFDPSIRGARAIGDKIRRDILALRGQPKPVMNTVREAVDTPVADAVAAPTAGVTGYGADATGNEMLQSLPPADAVPPDLWSQITNLGYTAAAHGFVWGGRLVMAAAVGIALWTAFKYIRYAWRKKFPPKPNEVESSRGVD